MSQMHYLYLSPRLCQGSWDWRFEPRTEGLPPVSDLLEAMTGFPGGKLTVLIKDDLMHPLRIELEEKPAKRELNHFLLWKLKRFIPYPVEKVVLRHIPMVEANQYLTFVLPAPWVDKLAEGIGHMNGTCGYIGGLAATLLENRTALRNKLSIWLFEDFYLLAELDDKGGYRNFRTRRLPFGTDDLLDLNTLFDADLAPALETATAGSASLINLAPVWDRALTATQSPAAHYRDRLSMPNLAGGTLDRFLGQMRGVAAS